MSIEKAASHAALSHWIVKTSQVDMDEDNCKVIVCVGVEALRSNEESSALLNMARKVRSVVPRSYKVEFVVYFVL